MSLTYSDAVKSRCREPHRAGSWPADTPHVGTGTVGSLDAGALARVQVRVSDDGAIVEDARFTAFGCSAVVASASYVADRVVGGSVSGSRELKPDDVVAALDLPEEKHAMAALATQAVRAAVADWESRAGLGSWGLVPARIVGGLTPTPVVGLAGTGSER
jgi:nitrogen fixation protein NifU and related proteins